MTTDTQRRNVLKAGILAAGAAMLPSAATAAVPMRPDDSDATDAALRHLREDYRRRVERLAEEFKPRFLSGEFGGFGDGDGDRMSDAQAEGREWLAPLWRLERTIKEQEIRSDSDAYLILACSPSERHLYDGDITAICHVASEAMAIDVCRVGFRDGWYRPDANRGEHPNARLLLDLDDEEAES